MARLSVIKTPEAAIVPAGAPASAEWLAVKDRTDPAKTARVSPLMFEGVGDGVTDDYSAVMQAYDALPAEGGILELAGRRWKSNSTLTFAANKAITIDGGAMADQAGVPHGGAFLFPDGINGLVFGAQTAPRLVNVGVFTPLAGSARSLGTGDGITINAQLAVLQNVEVSGFGRDGIHYESNPVVAGVNANFGAFSQVLAFYNGRDGIYLEGDDSNVHTWIGANAILNGRYGINNSAMYHNTFIGAHAYGNGTADYFDAALASLWLNPYSEGTTAKFVIHQDSRNGTLFLATDTVNAGAPIPYWTDGTSTLAMATDAFARNQINDQGWTIRRNGREISRPRHGHPDGSVAWEHALDTVVTGSTTFRNMAGGEVWATWDSGSNATFQARAPLLGFYGATPVTKPTALTAANSGTVDATYGQPEADVITNLRTRVNELETKLRALGLLT